MKPFTYSPLALSIALLPALCQAQAEDNIESITVIGDDVQTPKVTSSTGLALTDPHQQFWTPS